MHAYLFCIRIIEISVRIINVCGIILSRPPQDVNVDKEISYQNTALYIRPNIFDMRMGQDIFSICSSFRYELCFYKKKMLCYNMLLNNNFVQLGHDYICFIRFADSTIAILNFKISLQEVIPKSKRQTYIFYFYILMHPLHVFIHFVQ